MNIQERPPYFICLNKEQYEACANLPKSALKLAVDIENTDADKLNYLKLATTFTDIFYSLRTTEPVFVKTIIKLMLLQELERIKLPATNVIDELIKNYLKTVPYTLPFKVQQASRIVVLTVRAGPPYEVKNAREWEALGIFSALLETYTVETPRPDLFVNAIGLLASLTYSGFLTVLRAYQDWHLAYLAKALLAPPGAFRLPLSIATLQPPSDVDTTSFTILEATLVHLLDSIIDKKIALPISCRVTPAIMKAVWEGIDVEKAKAILEGVKRSAGAKSAGIFPGTSAVPRPVFKRPLPPAVTSAIAQQTKNPFKIPHAPTSLATMITPAGPSTSSQASSLPMQLTPAMISMMCSTPTPAAKPAHPSTFQITPAMISSMQAHAAAIPPEVIAALFSGKTTAGPTRLPVSSSSYSPVTNEENRTPTPIPSPTPVVPKPNRKRAKRSVDDEALRIFKIKQAAGNQNN